MRPTTLAVLAVLTALALPAGPLHAQTPLIEQGTAATHRGDFDAAIEILEKAVAQSPQSAEAHFFLGNAYGAKVQDGGMLAAMKYASKLTEEYEKAVALDPRSIEARYALVQVYAAAPGMMGGSYDKALDQAREIKALDPVYGHRAFSFIYSQQKKLDLAKKEYVDAIAEQPGSPKAHGFLGQFLVNVEKNYPAALAEFDTALKLDPAYMPALYHIGRTAALSSANLARGEETLKKYLAYTPKDAEPTLANAHYHLGTIYEKQGKKEQAKQSYEAALKLNKSLKLAAEALKRVS